MVTVSINDFIIIVGIVAAIVVAVFAFLVNKLIRYENRITKTETKLDGAEKKLGDLEAYYRILSTALVTGKSEGEKAKKGER